MYKSKLISMMRTLSSRELGRFESYIQSPFFNKNEVVLALYEYVSKYHPDYSHKNLNKDNVVKVLFPKEKGDLQKLRYVMTDLTKLLEEFLAYLEYEEKQHYRNYLLLDALNHRQLDKYFSSTYSQSVGALDAQSQRDVQYYFNRYLIEENAYLHSMSREAQELDTPLQQAVDNLDLYYLAQKLRYCCVMRNREETFQVKYETMMLPEILQFVERHDFSEAPAISVYYQILMTYIEPEEERHYQKIRKLLEKHQQLFSRAELKDMYVFTLNYCIHKLNTGHPEYLHELFTLYRHLVKEQLLLEEGIMSPADFKNIVIIALRSGQMDWAEEFIASEKSHLPEEWQEHTAAYAQAFVHYYRKDFSKALRLLQTVEFTDIYYHLDAKALLLRTYYELEDTEPFFSLTDAFTNYLKRNKLISDYYRNIYLNFVKYIRKLMLLRLGGRGTVKDVIEKLESSTEIASLQWLLTKARELADELGEELEGTEA